MQEIAEGGFKPIDHTFPFKLEDLVSWTVKRKDGTSAKFVLTEAAKGAEVIQPGTSGENRTTGIVPITKSAWNHSHVESSLGKYCDHTPKSPIAEWTDAERENGALRLHVGDVFGAKATKDNFDFIIDGGDVFTPSSQLSTILAGDPDLVKLLRDFTVEVPMTRLLQIDWLDRKAPDVIPQFWTELNYKLFGDVMTCCQGGHGRSGSAFVCLLLNNAPDYSALDAIVHLRAVHCPRAIESKIQHDYINDVAKFLKRDADAHDAEKIKDYREVFMASTRPTAVRARKTLGWDK